MANVGVGVEVGLRLVGVLLWLGWGWVGAVLELCQG